MVEIDYNYSMVCFFQNDDSFMDIWNRVKEVF